MLTGFRDYLAYRRNRWTATRELRGERRFRGALKPNFMDAAERARSEQEFRVGPLTGRTRYRPPQR